MRSDGLDSLPTEAAPERRDWKRPLTTLVSLAVSGVLLLLLYRSLDVSLVADALLRADKTWLVISIGAILPITYLRALRFYWIAPPGALPGVGEAFRLTLVASAFNVFLPANAGDLIKSYFVATRSTTPAGVALAIVVYERLCDVFGLIVWCLVGWIVGRPQAPGLGPAFWLILTGIGAMCAVLVSSERAALVLQAVVRRALPHASFRKLIELAEGWPGLLKVMRGRRLWIVSFSLALGLAHLVQIWLFTVALSMDIPFAVSAGLSAVALMAGQFALTFAGLGARDVALVVLLARYTTPELAAALGVLTSTRGFLPPLLALPILRPYLSSALEDARAWRRKPNPVP